jgi:hypothetical protein
MRVTVFNTDREFQAVVTIYDLMTNKLDEVFVQPGSKVDLPANHRVHQNSLVQYPKLKETVDTYSSADVHVVAPSATKTSNVLATEAK